MTRLVIAAFLAGLPLPAVAVTADDVIAEAEAFCRSFENGTITVGTDVVQSVELTGDSSPETIIDYKGISCSTLASAWGGTGGTTLAVLIDDLTFFVAIQFIAVQPCKTKAADLPGQS